ncbi:MAG: aromatic ring-hydroxylating dioxygenase subunit alpha [Sphingomonadaceae bacterium]|nr:aromatic ring-hydroxylating dioxygenase subunit alpha [Sphingomonadaceae bacterium]
MPAPQSQPLEQFEASLPGWLYHDPEFYAVEAERVLRPAWVVVCHVSDIAEPGEWRTIEYLGESILAIRCTDGAVHAHLNLCRHRGSRLVDGGGGCVRKLVCPYHAWTYELDGRLSGVPERQQYPGLDPARLGLLSVEHEVWESFVFVRLKGGGPSVAAMMAPHMDWIRPYRFADLRAIGRVTMRRRELNWKTIADNYSDALHIPVAHPGLTRLFGRGYGIEANEHVDRMWGELVDAPSVNPSERAYQRLLPRVAHLPEQLQRLWLYFKLWPTTAFDIYPDQIDFMQFLPTGPRSATIREISYALPDDRREMRAARYLNWRINRRVNAEDTVLISRVQAGMESPNYRPGPLGESEVALRSFARRLRGLIPEARLDRPPPPGWSRARGHATA